jgi:hypothetical protein
MVRVTGTEGICAKTHRPRPPWLKRECGDSLPSIGLEAFAHADGGFYPAEIIGSVSSRPSPSDAVFLHIHEAPVTVVLAQDLAELSAKPFPVICSNGSSITTLVPTPSSFDNSTTPPWQSMSCRTSGNHRGDFAFLGDAFDERASSRHLVLRHRLPPSHQST